MIKKSRIQKRLTQKKLGIQVGASQGYISKLENNNVKFLNLTVIRKISYKLNLNYDELIKWLSN